MSNERLETFKMRKVQRVEESDSNRLLQPLCLQRREEGVYHQASQSEGNAKTDQA